MRRSARWLALTLVLLLVGSVLWPSFVAGTSVGVAHDPASASSDSPLTQTVTSTLVPENGTATPPGNASAVSGDVTPPDPENVTPRASPGSPEQPENTTSVADSGASETSAGAAGASPESPEQPATPDEPPAPERQPTTSGTPTAPGSPGPPASAVPDRGDRSPPRSNATLPSGRVRPVDGSNDTARVNVSVRNVTPGDPVRVEIAPPANASNRTTVGVRRLTVEPTDGDPFALNVTTGDAPLSTTPAFDPDTGTLELGYIRVNHTIPDSDIGHVNFTVRVNRSALNATGTPPDEVALYRYSDGSWSALPTRVVAVTNQSVILEARSPGLSDFLVGAQQPRFEIAKALVSATAVTTGEDVAVRVRITNVGKADGSYTVKLKIDRQVVAERDVTVAANGTRQVTFTRTFQRAGAYTVLVNQKFAGKVNVTRENLGTAAPTTVPPTTVPPKTTTAKGVGFGSAIGVSALLAAIGLLGRRVRDGC